MKPPSFLVGTFLAVAALSGSAWAQMTSSGPRNLDIPDTFDGIFLSFADPGDATVVATATEEPVGTPWHVNPFFTGVSIGTSDVFAPVVTSATTNAPIAKLSLGDEVGPSRTFPPLPPGFSGSTTHVGISANQFTSGTPAYLGFRLRFDDANHYGYMRLTLRADGTPGIIHDWAWNTVPDAPAIIEAPKLNQTITFGALAAKTFGDAPFSVEPTASSSLPVSLISLTPAVATVSGNTVTIVGAGTATLRATQAGDAGFNAAAPVEQTLVVAPKPITVVAEAKTKQFGQPDPSLSFLTTGLLGLDAVTGSLSRAPGEAPGTYAITASVAFSGGPNYLITFTGANLTIEKADQTITFQPPAAKTFGDTSFDLSATATSNLPVTFTSLNEAIATVSGQTVTITGAGTVTLRATQAGDANYHAAPAVERQLQIDPKAVSVVADAKTKVFGQPDPEFTYQVTGLLGTDAVTGTLVRAPGEDAGTYAITEGTPFSAGANYAVSFTGASLTISKADQTITFAALPVKGLGDAPFSLVATASSGLAVSFASDAPDVATVSGTTVTLNAAGVATITATQTGGPNHNAALPVERVLTVYTAIQKWRFDNFGSPLNAGPGANTANGGDADQLSNLAEFAFGLDPNVDDNVALTVTSGTSFTEGSPVSFRTFTGETMPFTARFVRRRDFAAAGLTYTPQFSQDLQTWTNTTETPVVVADEEGLHQVVEVPYLQFLPNGQKAKFFQVSVTIAE